jgi:DNA excision repair protein ERCC-2
MLFPFASMRESQKDLVKDVTNALETGSNLLANAPTGIGKTAAALSPALEYALENGKTVLFLTPRHSQHDIALETLKKLREKREFRVSDVIGKKWLCSFDVDDFSSGEFTDFCRSMVTDERCPYFKATRTDDRTITKEAEKKLKVVNNELFHAEEFKKKFSKSYCSYEMLMEAAKTSDVIVADYYHIFSPARAATLARIKKDPEDLILIVDEGHNLPSRVRSLMSERITTFSVLSAEKEARVHGQEEAEDIAVAVYNILNVMQKGLEGEGYAKKEDFLYELKERAGSLDEIKETLESAAEYIRKKQKKSFIASLLKFIESWKDAEEGFTRVVKKGHTRSGKSFVTLSLTCLDPSLYTKEIIESAHSTILMSGTLFPQKMYSDILGFPENTEIKSYDSPFPSANRLNVIIPETSTKYSRRTEENFTKMAEHITTCVNKIKGNCAVFFPSYYIRDMLYQKMKDNIIKPVLLEEQNSNKEKRKELYNKFVSLHKKGAALFGVQAGSFSEGIDLAGDFLNGVIVVGIPLERPDLITKSLIDYYDLRFQRGWDYGYAYPAMIRCLQAAGRCIRTENDRGVCIFIDERFMWGNYKKVFPADMKFTVTKEPELEINSFWKGIN